jgi:lysozyme
MIEAIRKLLARFEGCVLKAYQDVVGVWTIGYGETLGVQPGMEWSQEQADQHLQARAAWFLLQAYTSCPQLHLEPADRVAACVSLEYNIGVAAFRASSVCRRTKAREYQSAAESFRLWNKARGRVIAGLTWRRKVEAQMYLNAR